MDRLITPSQLQERLRESGREVTLRTLTDWRSKRLLPPLIRQSRGPNRGVLRVSNPDDFERACIIFDTLSRVRRTDAAILALWYSGHSVPPAIFRQASLKHVGAMRLKRRHLANDFIGDTYASEIDSLARKVAEGRCLPPSAARAIAYEAILAVNADSSGGRSEDELRAIIDAAPALSRTFGKGVVEILTLERFKALQSFYRPLVSLREMGVLFRSATNRQLLIAHNYYCELGDLIGGWVALAAKGAGKAPQIYDLKLAMGPVFGPVFFRMILYLVRSRDDWRLRNTFDLFSRFENAARQHPNFPPQKPNGDTDFVGELAKIWRGLKPKRLYP